MKKIISLLLLCAFVLPLAACDGADKIAERVKSNIADIAEEFSDTPDSEENAKAPVENSINMGITGFDTFNPLLTQSQTVREAMQLVYEPLFEADEAMHTVPVLASGYSISADGLTYNITIKKDVLWHDGKTFDAYDAAYTIKQIMSGVTPYTDRLKDVADYRAVSNDTLRIVLKKPVPQFVLLLSFPIVKYQSEMTVNPSYNPVGTGAFEFKGKIGIDKYALSSFGLYHNGKAKIDNVYIQTAPDAEQYRSMFEVSETDIITSTNVDLTTYMPKGKSRFKDFLSNRLTFIGFNLHSSVLVGTSTRAGLARLINKDNIVDTVLYSRGVASDTPVNPYSWLYYDANTNFSGSRENALELLGNDGWGFNDDGYLQRTVNGKKGLLKLVILTDSESSIKSEIADKIKEDFEKCGIKAVIDAQPYEKYMQKAAAHDYDIFIGECDLGINQDITPLAGSAENYFYYQNKNIDMLISQSGMTQDEDSLKEIYCQICEIIKHDVPFVPLYYAKESVLLSSKIKSGTAPSVSGAFRVSNVWSVLE